MNIKSPFTGGQAAFMQEEKVFSFRKDAFTVVQFYYKCIETGQEFTTDTLDQINVNQVYSQYQHKHEVEMIFTAVEYPQWKAGDVFKTGMSHAPRG
jgi:hypothetical protein